MWLNLDHACAVAHNLLQHVCIYISCVLMFTCTYTCLRNSPYLLKCSFQIYQKSIVVLVLEVQRYDSKQYDALKALSHGAIFLGMCNAILYS